jgi:protein O-GlcNAc transferase
VNLRTPSRQEQFLAQIEPLINDGAWQDVARECDAMTAAGEAGAEVDYLRAVAAYQQGDVVGAVSFARQAYDSDPATVEYADLLAILHAVAGDIANAAFFVKMASVGRSNPRLKGLLPDDFPEFSDVFLQARERPFYEAGLGAASRGEWSNAAHWLQQHLSFHPKDCEAYAMLANALMITESYRSAVETLRAGRHALPDDPRIASLLATALTGLGAFDAARSCHAWAMKRGGDDPVFGARAFSDSLLDPQVDPASAARACAEWGRRFGIGNDLFPPRSPMPGKQRLTIAYLVGAVDRRRVAPQAAAIFAHHKANRFRVVGYGFGKLSDGFNVVFQKCFESWIDVQDTDPLTFGSMVMAEDVDVLVDLSGFATPHLLTAFGARLAPVQIAWLGAPCGTGLAAMDAMFTDGVLDSGDSSVAETGERLIRLKLGCPLVDMTPAGDRPEEARQGDGEAPLTFAADATLAELSIPTVAVWAEILHAVPDSTLLLQDHEFRNPANLQHLIGLFGNFGVAHRIDVVLTDSPVEFFRQADIALAPLRAARPEIATAALQAGVPVICMAGEGRFARQAASVLHHLGMAEGLVAGSADEYVRLSVAMAEDEAGRRALTGGISERLDTAPLMDNAGRAAELEGIYEDLWRHVNAA